MKFGVGEKETTDTGRYAPPAFSVGDKPYGSQAAGVRETRENAGLRRADEGPSSSLSPRLFVEIFAR